MTNIEELLEKAIKDGKEDDLFLKDENQAITYGEALNKVQRIASYLLKREIRKSPILVPIKDKVDTLLLFFGIALSGNCYVPVDEETPIARLNDIMEIGEIRFAFDLKHEKVETLSFLEASSSPVDKKVLKETKGNQQIDDPLYLMFTSGSTGKPKGVLKSHRNILAFVTNFLETFPSIPKNIRIANQAPLYFDASSKDIYLTLALEGALFFPKASDFALPAQTIGYLNDNKIQMIMWVPSALSVIAKLRTLKFMKPNDLEYVFFIGESFQPKYLNMWLEALPNTHFYNWYGSTEVAGAVLYHEIKEKIPETLQIPVGKPLKNDDATLLDGEIYLQSDQIALGYIHNEEKNRETFVKIKGKRWLKTGDFGVYNKDCDIVFETRKDFQIKHMGYRIELQDIEIVLGSLPFVDSCCCLYQEDKDKIVLFVEISKNHCNISDGELIASFKKLLPSYMIPQKIIRVEKMPLNKNGKIDRALLSKELEETH